MLSIVATPIGNTKDITLRAIEALKECDGILCEDTRVTGKLLQLLELPKKPLTSYHSHNQTKRIPEVLERLKKGEHLVLVSDAGTPGISDPGNLVVSAVQDAGLELEVLPGASAMLAALSVAGLPIHRFTYLGFLPMKKGRKKMLASIKDSPYPTCFFESVHRIEKCLSELGTLLADEPERIVVVARELTKLHEDVIRTTADKLPELATSIKKKGEFVVVVG
jgi:16S rRNA (cytidine1402-2'-O)-methyltransferase